MKITIGIGTFIIILLCGCAKQERIHSTAPPSPKREVRASPDNSGQIGKRPDLNAIDELSSRIDNGVRKTFYSKRFFGGFLANPEQPRLDWEKFKSEQQRSEATGYPDTYMNVWLEHDKIVYATSERGMTSGVGWWERCKYYFRPDGTLAKLIFTYSSGVGRDGGELIRYHSPKGNVIHSSLKSKDEAEKSLRQPAVYLHSTSLPVYRFLKKTQAR